MNPLEPFPVGAARGRVLLIEDFAPWRRQISELLRAEREFDVEEVADAYSALRLTQGSPYWHLVVIDLDLPGMNGFELYFRLREAVAEELAVVFTTSLPDAGWVRLGGGETRVVQKPVEPAEFLGLVRRELAGAASVPAGPRQPASFLP